MSPIQRGVDEALDALVLRHRLLRRVLRGGALRRRRTLTPKIRPRSHNGPGAFSCPNVRQVPVSRPSTVHPGYGNAPYCRLYALLRPLCPVARLPIPLGALRACAWSTNEKGPRLSTGAGEHARRTNPYRRTETPAYRRKPGRTCGSVTHAPPSRAVRSRPKSNSFAAANPARDRVRSAPANDRTATFPMIGTSRTVPNL